MAIDAKTRKKLLAFLEANPGAKRGDFANAIQELGKKDSSTLWRYLAELKREGVVRSEGDLKGTRYYVRVPSERERDVEQAVADIVRYGHTFALDMIPREQGRPEIVQAVQRALDQLDRSELQRYGLTEQEFATYLESRTSMQARFPDDGADLPFVHHETVSEAPAMRG
jgi:hypothetical protein